MAVLHENQPDHSSVKKRRADDQQNTPQQNSDHNIPDENTSAPTDKHSDQSKTEDNQIPRENFPDQSESRWPGPVSRDFPGEAYCISKTLNPKDVVSINPKLYISDLDYFILSRSLKILERKKFVVLDEGGRKYNMILSNQIHGEYVTHSISADWERFIKIHNLQAGDEISFYRVSDVNVSDDSSYILKYIRKYTDSKFIDAQSSIKSSDAGLSRKVKDDKKQPELKFDRYKSEFKVESDRAFFLVNKLPRNVPDPDFSIHHRGVMTREAYCLSKTLTSIEVVHKNPKLYFDPYEASVLVDHPYIGRYPLKKFSKPLIVFDGMGRKYNMNFSHCVSGGKIRSYSINTGWKSFLKKHNLKEGYQLTFYRFRQTGVRRGVYYYVLKYFRKPQDIVDQKDEYTLSMAKKNVESSEVGDNVLPVENIL
ncbi:hypothetical protein OROGR_027924 [Orobanche gracilis]